MPEFDVSMFLFGCCGGLLPDVLRFIKNKGQDDVFEDLGKVKYWVVLILQVALGGFAAYLMSTASVKDAIIVGFTAPEVIGALVAKKEETKPSEEPGEGEKKKGEVAAEGEAAAAWDVEAEAPAKPEARKKAFNVRAWLAK